jgi:8-oxo-dGTP pyrophosphatase MutT (NUDIX family)
MSIQNSLGVIRHDHPSTRRTDYLYRVSLKCLVWNDKGEVLIVKETGRGHWDLPGGGMDHGEAIKAAIAREMDEEVSLQGDFGYRIVSVDEPAHLRAYNFWQLRLIYEITPSAMVFAPGEDADAIAFKDPREFKDSGVEVERRIYRYAIASGRLAR